MINEDDLSFMMFNEVHKTWEYYLKHNNIELVLNRITKANKKLKKKTKDKKDKKKPNMMTNLRKISTNDNIS